MDGVTGCFIFAIGYTTMVLCVLGRLIWGGDYPANTFMGRMQIFLRKTDFGFWKFVFLIIIFALCLMIWTFPLLF